MKASATLLAVLTGVVLTMGLPARAQRPVLGYMDLVREVVRLEALEGSEYRLSSEVLDQRVRLDVKRFGLRRDSDGRIDSDRIAFYVRPDDGLVFTCAPTPGTFSSGVLEARVVRHAPGAAGGHFFTLSECMPAK